MTKEEWNYRRNRLEAMLYFSRGDKKMVSSQTMPRMADYYNGKTLFITGGTGFMGKVSIEKILRTLPGVKKIFILIRPKRGVTPAERVKRIRKSKVFDRLQSIKPDPFEKIHPILGEISEANLSISEEDRKTLIEEVNIIFHVAASVQFTDSVCTALKTNVRGTRELAELAKQMKSLESFIHVSTAYCNVWNDDYRSEEIYPAVQNWEDLLDLLEEQPGELNTLTGRFLCGHPNTYTMTKSLAEQVIKSYQDCFPVTVYRPGVVTNSFKEPFPGWVDTFFGPSILGILAATGLLRVHYGHKEMSVDYICVDHAVNGMLIAPYDKHVNSSKDLKVINAVYGDTMRISHGEIEEYGWEQVAEKPLRKVIWYPFIIWTKSSTLFTILFFLLQVLPACVAEVLLIISGSKFRILKLVKKVISVKELYQFFTVREFRFPNQQYLELGQKLVEEDKAQFAVVCPPEITNKQLYHICSEGAFQYLLKEPEKTPELIRRLQWRDFFLKVIHNTICLGFLALVVYAVGKRFFLYSQ